jgi:DNA-directed RNA polymerase specialized sigma24 family protein
MTKEPFREAVQQPRANVEDESLRQVKLSIEKCARAFASVGFTQDDVEDLVQNSWIKFWKASPQEVISLKSYVRQIVHHEFVSMLRQRKGFLLLETTEEGEYIYPQETLIIGRSEAMGDPQEVLEHREDAQACMHQVMDVVRELPPRQQFALRCLLYERVDNLIALVDAFRKYRVNGEMGWPDEKVEKQRLQASCKPARTKIARHLGIDLSRW